MIAITDKEFKVIQEYLKSNFGINLKAEKKSLVVGRLQNILIQKNFQSFADYFNYVISDNTGDAATELINKMTTNHTFFMRESNHFEYFRDKVLPYITSNNKKRDLRIWSAGCSSGEEPYTLAMIMDSFLGTEKKMWDSRILATDISTKVLDKAMKGIYSNEQVGTLPKTWQLNYTSRSDNGYSMIIDRIRNDIIFRVFNLMERDFPFKGKFHVIFCRNVMIYFDYQTKKELVDKFYEFTEPGGYLFIGHSESLNRDDTKYRYIMPAVYRKE